MTRTARVSNHGGALDRDGGLKRQECKEFFVKACLASYSTLHEEQYDCIEGALLERLAASRRNIAPLGMFSPGLGR